MSTRTQIPDDEPVIVMTRTYDAPRHLVWLAITEPEQVRKWWGGPEVTNPECEMDVRPGGRWRQVMRFSSGHELRLDSVFLEVEPPARLVWEQHSGDQAQGSPRTFEVTLAQLGLKTEWTMVARFRSFEDRSAAVAAGFAQPIQASSVSLARHLTALCKVTEQ